MTLFKTAGVIGFVLFVAAAETASARTVINLPKDNKMCHVAPTCTGRHSPSQVKVPSRQRCFYVRSNDGTTKRICDGSKVAQ